MRFFKMEKWYFLKKPQSCDFFENCSKIPSWFPKIWHFYLYRDIKFTLKSFPAQCVINCQVWGLVKNFLRFFGPPPLLWIPKNIFGISSYDYDYYHHIAKYSVQTGGLELRTLIFDITHICYSTKTSWNISRNIKKTIYQPTLKTFEI